MTGLKLNLTSSAKPLIATVNKTTENLAMNPVIETKKIIIGGNSQLSPVPAPSSGGLEVGEKTENQASPEPIIKKKRISISDIKQEAPIITQESPKEVEVLETKIPNIVPVQKNSVATITLTSIVSAKTQEVLDAPTQNQENQIEETEMVVSPLENENQELSKTESTPIPLENTETKALDQEKDQTIFSIIDGDTNVTMLHTEKREIFGAYHSEFEKSKAPEKKNIVPQVANKTPPEKNPTQKKGLSPLSIFSKSQSTQQKKEEQKPIVEKIKADKKPLSTTQKSLIGVFGLVAMVGLGIGGLILSPDNSIKTNILETIGFGNPKQTTPTVTQSPPKVEPTPPTQPLSETGINQTPDPTEITQTPITPPNNTTISPEIKKALLKKFNNK